MDIKKAFNGNKLHSWTRQLAVFFSGLVRTELLILQQPGEGKACGGLQLPLWSSDQRTEA